MKAKNVREKCITPLYADNTQYTQTRPMMYFLLAVLMVFVGLGFSGCSPDDDSSTEDAVSDQVDSNPDPDSGPGGEPIGSNNLSFPVIWADNKMSGDFTPSSEVWLFADIPDTAICVDQDDLVSEVPADVPCYWGQKNLGIDEATGEFDFDGDVKIWWLQQRQLLGNQWQVFNIADAETENDDAEPVVVTAVDTGDLLESSLVIKAKRIRTEFTLMKRIEADEQLGNATDADYLPYLMGEAGLCELADNTEEQGPPNNCFAAHDMSGAVPGTDRSINEIQGSSYGNYVYYAEVDSDLLDPRLVKLVTNYYDKDVVMVEAAAVEPEAEAEEPGDPHIVAVEPAVGMDALIYSDCARLVIQRITGDADAAEWPSDSGDRYWQNGMSEPIVDIGAWDGSYSVEINAGGNLIYGYNWNRSLLEAGGYRITFVLEADTAHGGQCTTPLNTLFDEATKSVNVGERRPAQIMSADELEGGQGGLVYVDVTLGTTGGGGGGGHGN